jgi:hypothetical protein
MEIQPNRRRQNVDQIWSGEQPEKLTNISEGIKRKRGGEP